MQKLEFEKDDMIPDPDLTKMDNKIRLVIAHGSGKILKVFNVKDRNHVVKKLVEKHGLKKVRENNYGDLILM